MTGSISEGHLLGMSMQLWKGHHWGGKGDRGSAQTICINPGNQCVDRCHSQFSLISSNLNVMKHLLRQNKLYTIFKFI